MLKKDRKDGNKIKCERSKRGGEWREVRERREKNLLTVLILEANTGRVTFSSLSHVSQLSGEGEGEAFTFPTSLHSLFQEADAEGWSQPGGCLSGDLALNLAIAQEFVIELFAKTDLSLWMRKTQQRS